MSDVENIENVINESLVEDDGDVDSRVYELGYHIIPAISEEEAPKEAEALKDLIKRNGGVIISEEAPNRIDLAYTMYRTENGKKTKFDSAYFGGIKFEMDQASVHKIKEVLDINKNILRYIIFKTVKENTRTDIRLPQVRLDKKMDGKPRVHLRKKEEDVPVSEEALDKSMEEIVVE
jgi:ribosomal protein S6